MTTGRRLAAAVALLLTTAGMLAGCRDASPAAESGAPETGPTAIAAGEPTPSTTPDATDAPTPSPGQPTSGSTFSAADLQAMIGSVTAADDLAATVEQELAADEEG